jgi:tetratricopeptide (TPR) repeat protein
LAVAGLILFLIVLLGAGGGWVIRDRVARQAQAAHNLQLALDRADLFQGQGKREEALAALDRAELLAGQAPPDPARHERLAALRERLAAEKRDQQFIARFDDIRLRAQSQVDLVERRFVNEAAFPELRQALRQYGIPVVAVAPAEAGARILGRPEPVRRVLLSALDECLHWAPHGEEQTRQWLLATLQVVDADPWRRQVRRALLHRDANSLETLSRAVNVRTHPPGLLVLVAEHLPEAMNSNRLDLLRRIQRAYPADLWANMGLAFRLATSGQPAQAVRYYTAALALRPDSPGISLNRGVALYLAGELEASIADSQQALVLAPGYASAHHNLGLALKAKGRLDEAIAEYRAAIRLQADVPEVHSSLGNALLAKGQIDDAIAEIRQAIRLNKDIPEFYSNLGNALSTKGQPDEAIAACREAIRLNKSFPGAHINLGNALSAKGRPDEAIAAYREAIRLDKDLAEPHCGICDALLKKGLVGEAIAECREAIRLKKDYAMAQDNLGNALLAKGQIDHAIAAYREAIRLEPNGASAYTNLGCALRAKNLVDDAIAAHRKAIRADSHLPEAHHNLGNTLFDKGQIDEAIAEMHEAIRLRPGNAEFHYDLGNALRVGHEGHAEQAIAEYREAIRLQKDFAEAHCNLGQLLKQDGQCREALEELRRGHELGSRRPDWRYPSLQWVRECERLAELDEKLASILDGKTTPASLDERIELAGLSSLKRSNRAAARFYEEAFAADPKLASDLDAAHRYNAACAAALAGCGQGGDTDKLDVTERARLRREALDWLRADLDAWRRLRDREPDQARSAAAVTQVLQHWLVDPDLASVRGPEALAKLPEAEQRAWQALWSGVADTLSGVLSRRAPEKTPSAK